MSEANRRARMINKQRELMAELGFDPGDDEQNWLRLHEILKDHEDRISELEERLYGDGK